MMLSIRTASLATTLAASLLVAWLLATAVLATPVHAQSDGQQPDSIETQAETVLATYTVQSGDTLFVIAQQFGVSLDELVQLNGILDPSLLEVGQSLLIPVDPSQSDLPAALVATVTAQPGDTLRTVARRYNQEPNTLASLNTLDLSSRLFPGQPLRLPPATEVEAPVRFGAVVRLDIPDQLVQGRTGRVWIDTRRSLTLAGTWNKLEVHFTPLANNPLRQFALLPVPALLVPGDYPLVLSYVAANGHVLSQTWQVTVAEGDYESQEIYLPPDRGALLDPAIVQAELERVTAAWSQVGPQLMWDRLLVRPVSAEYPTTSPYGTRRSYDGGPYSSYHAGQDFGVPEGIPVVAPGDGFVAMAAPLDVRGNAILIDHGRGIFTGYWHLSELLVESGQLVRAGDVVGMVGNTGLSTGAHLHWEMRIYGIAVDPLQFLTEPFVLTP